MVDARPCPACGHVNTVAAEACANCGEPLAVGDIPVHPGETFRDPDDLSFPEPPVKGERAPGRGEPKRAGAIDLDRARAARAVEGYRGATAAGTMAALADAAAARAETTAAQEAEAQALRELAERIALRRAAARDAAREGARERPAHYAGFVIRAVAFAIDVAILVTFTVPLTMAALYGVKAGLVAAGGGVDLSQIDEALSRLLGLAWLGMAAAYFTTLHAGTGQTIGKAIVGIAVRRARDLAGIGVVRSLIRVLAYALSVPGFLFAIVMIIGGPRKRGWHDWLAGTCVVHLAPEEA